MQQINAAQLAQWIADNKDIVLVDVREKWEHENFNIGGILIPLGELMLRKEELPKDKTLVLYCEKGIRSVIAIQRLETYGYEDMYNLAGGMSAWREFSM
ncbi:MAG: rhodanese-like domain-containing protein [Bacteroidota bacterium]